MKPSEVIVIGGGIAGCSTALHLALRGTGVTLLEKNVAGAQASGVNAGGVRRLWRHVAEIPLSMAAHDIWHRIESVVDNDCGFVPCGQLSVAENHDEMAFFVNRVEELKNLGYDHEKLLDREQLRQIAPAVAPHCVGGLYCQTDGAAEPYKTTKAFFEKAKRLGVQAHEGHRVVGIERAQGLWKVRAGDRTFEAPVLVNCAGAWGGGIADLLGDRVPLSPEAAVLTVTARVPRFLTPVLLTEGRRLSFKQMPNGSVVVGGGYWAKLDFKTEKARVDYEEMKIMAQTVTDLFPLMKQVPIVRFWTGIKAIMKDKIPVIGPSRHSPDAYHAFGFSAHGFQLGPITGRVMSELVLDGGSKLPIEPFSIERFTEPARV